MLSLPNYNPIFFNDAKKFLTKHHKSLCALNGGTLTNYFLAWNIIDNTLHNDLPVILIVNDTQYEFTADHLDFGLTVNQIDTSRQFDLHNLGDELQLEWKNDCQIELSNFIGKQIKTISLLEYCEYQYRFSLVGIEIEFNDCDTVGKYLQIVNAFDTNELIFLPFVEDEKNQKTKVVCS